MRATDLALAGMALAAWPAAGTLAQDADPRLDQWAIEEGFRIEIDADGFSMPSALAFVPEPGDAPDDPLYYVLELRGLLKVVTNDRSVHTFADLPALGYQYTPQAELPDGYGQGGAAGLCLDPARGHVFATFVYSDEREHVRYNMIRFDTEPGTFGLSYDGHLDFVDLFGDVIGAITHQIGPCLVRNGDLYLSVGDTWQPFEAQNLDSPLGKILRMDLEGNAVSTNPFHGQAAGFRDYVWAYGLRNPFSVVFVEDRLFVADNGIQLDRFMPVEAGVDYLYDGTDGSIATNAQYVWEPSLGPVQMDFVPAGALGFPDRFTNTFFVALSAEVTRDKLPGIYALRYDLDAGRMASVPGYFVRHDGSRYEMGTGLAVGPDGLYFAALSPGREGETPIYRITWDPERAHARTLRTDRHPRFILRDRGCIGCHVLQEEGEAAAGQYGAGIGPPLALGGEMYDRLGPRLNTEAYEDHLRMLMASETYSNPHYDALREEVLAASGGERVRVWLHHFIRSPDFDKTYVPQMPDVGLSDDEAEVIVAYLLEAPPEPTTRDRIRGLIPRPLRAVHLGAAFGGGFVLGALLLSAIALAFRRRRRPAQAP